MSIYEKSMRGMLLNITMGHSTYLEGGMIGYVADPRRGRGPDRTGPQESKQAKSIETPCSGYTLVQETRE